MSNVLRTLCITVLILFILTATPALADFPHAWVGGFGEALLEDYTYWYHDYYDNTPGNLLDTMGATKPGWGTFSGSASTSTGLVTLYTQVLRWHYMEAWANILDTYRFYDLNNPGRTGLVPDLHAAITVSGKLTADKSMPSFWVGTGTSYTKGAFQLFWDNQQQQYNLRTYIPHDNVDMVQVTGSSVYVSAVFPFDISANFGEDFSLNLFYKASDSNWNGVNGVSEVDFLSTATLRFYTTDPNFQLGVSSQGGFVPLPGSLLLLGSGLLGLAGLRRKYKK